MTREEKVIKVIGAYNMGQDLSGILKQFKCSKSWLYKWLKRYKENPNGQWYLEQSRKPKTIHYSVSEQQIRAVIEARLSLENKPYSQKGTISIQYELRQQQTPVLPVWKINKILKKANLNHKEPWRNGIIEKFNDSFNKRFVRGKTYADFENLQKLCPGI